MEMSESERNMSEGSLPVDDSTRVTPKRTKYDKNTHSKLTGGGYLNSSPTSELPSPQAEVILRRKIKTKKDPSARLSVCIDRKEEKKDKRSPRMSVNVDISQIGFNWTKTTSSKTELLEKKEQFPVLPGVLEQAQAKPIVELPPPTQSSHSPINSPLSESKLEKTRSKLSRPTTKKPKKKSLVYGTLPRLMGGGSDDKEKEKKLPSNGSSVGNLGVTPSLRSKKRSGTHDNPITPPSLEPSVPTSPAPVSEPTTAGKWKRGAEAEAILKLLSETKELLPQAQSSAASDTTSAVLTPTVIQYVDASAIMKILGLEEPGIKLPEKHNDGDEKALDPISELKLTERNFIADLGLLNETFVKPVRSNHILPSSTVDLMELNLDRLISLHRELYKNILQDCSLKGITKTFNSKFISELERIYTVYMGHYERAIQVFYDKRDTVAQFRKFLKQREEQVTDKSIPNLLVIPVQRVCKYELMLASINKTTMKPPEARKDKKLKKYSKKLTQKIEELNIALQNIDKKRAAADSYDKIIELESNILCPEPLAKSGRTIVGQIDTPIKIKDQEQVFKLVLFNDILIRTKLFKKTKKARLIDSIPLHHLQVVDYSVIPPIASAPTSLNSSLIDQNRLSFQLININSRIDSWTVFFNTEDEKKTWFNYLNDRCLSVKQFMEDWQLPKSEKLLLIDSGRWPQEYVNECRIFITTSYICILWKSFGEINREKIQISSINSCQIIGTGKERGIKCNFTFSTNWKQDYTFTALQFVDLVEHLINKVLQQPKTTQSLTSSSGATRTASSGITMCNTPFLSKREWKKIWKLGETCNYPVDTVIIEYPSITSSSSSVSLSSRGAGTLFQLVSGSIKILKSGTQNEVILSEQRKLFGISNFFGSPAQFDRVIASSDAVVLKLHRDVIMRQVNDVQAKFFTFLASQLACY